VLDSARDELRPWPGSVPRGPARCTGRAGHRQRRSRSGRRVDEIRKSGGEATASFDDISTPEGAASLVRGAIDAYGTIDILVNNAAIGRFTTMSDATIEEYELVRRVGLDGTFYVTREVWPIMVWTAGMAASSSPPQATASSITRHRSATRSRRQGCTA
jgi:NAD(P)-dependent dehydrogenase (short-subunit alcohol dehydrogenase family)